MVQIDVQIFLSVWSMPGVDITFDRRQGTQATAGRQQKLVGGLVAIFYFPINIGLLSSSQLTFIFFTGVQTTNQKRTFTR